MSDLKITKGGRERVRETARLNGIAFRDDPVMSYFMSSFTKERRHSYMPAYMHSILTAAALNAATFFEVADYGSIMVLMPPNKRVDNPWTLLQSGILGALYNVGLKGCRRMITEFEPQADTLKRKAMPNGKHHNCWYVFFVATAEDQRGKGLSSALLRVAQETAAKNNLPVWLEATTEYSWRLYGKLGFETVGTIVLGNGKVGANGMDQRDGEGVPVRGMIWWPPKKREARGVS
jgi:ribosomal protein S18 acetylase RimI-like enzyme